MNSKRLIAVIAAGLLLLSLNNPLHSQVLISLLFGDELNSENVKFGLDGGINFSNLTRVAGSGFEENFNLGLYFDIRLKAQKNWYLHTGALLKSDMGARGIEVYPLDDSQLDTVFSGGSIERQLKYINIPVLVRYKFKKHFFIELGPMFGILTKATDVFYNDVNKKEDLSFKNVVTSKYNWFDAGLEGGIGYQLMKGTGVNFGVRYYQGFIGVLKDNSTVWNQSLYLFVSIPVGAGEKSKAKKAEKAKKTP